MPRKLLPKTNAADTCISLRLSESLCCRVCIEIKGKYHTLPLSSTSSQCQYQVRGYFDHNKQQKDLDDKTEYYNFWCKLKKFYHAPRLFRNISRYKRSDSITRGNATLRRNKIKNKGRREEIQNMERDKSRNVFMNSKDFIDVLKNT